MDDVDTAARIARARFETLGQGGLLYTVPPPEETSLIKALKGQVLVALAP